MTVKNIVIMLVGLGLLYAMFTVGLPFLLALVFAIFLEPINGILMKYGKMNRFAAATATCTMFTLGVLGLVYLIGLKVFTELFIFIKKLPSYIPDIQHFVEDLMARLHMLFDRLPEDMTVQLEKSVETGAKALTDTLQSLLTGISGSFLMLAKAIPNLLIFFIVLIVALYLFSFSLNTLKTSFLSLFEEQSRKKVDEVLGNLRSSIFGFLRAQITLSVLTYIVALIGLLILKVDYPLAIALLIILVDILPILGTGSVLVPWAVYSIVMGNSFLGIGLIVMFVVITVFRRMIEPKILGDSVGIGALSALISLYVGFKIAGVVGLFLGPIVVILYQAMRKVGLINLNIKLE